MTGTQTNAGMAPVERTELVTQDMEAIARLVSKLYVEHRAQFRLPTGATALTVFPNTVADGPGQPGTTPLPP